MRLMARNNNNAGMHIIQYRANFDDLAFYNRKEKEKKDEQKRREEQQKKAIEEEIIGIRLQGTHLIDVLYRNIAYYSYKKGIDLAWTLAEIDTFIHMHVEEYDQACECHRVLFYAGLLCSKLGLDTAELFYDQVTMIEEYFLNEVEEIVADEEEDIFIYGDQIVLDCWNARFYIYPDDDEYILDVYYPGLESDYSHNHKKDVEKKIIPLGFNIICGNNSRVLKVYEKAIQKGTKYPTLIIDK